MFGLFSWLLGFMIIFRTSQAYARYLTGAAALLHMCCSFFEAVCSLTAFVRMSKESPEKVLEFKHTVVRLCSLLSALCMQDISEEGMNSEIEVIDAVGLDCHALQMLRESDSRPLLVLHWIMCVIVEGIDSGVLNVPPPILGRAFQGMVNGLTHCEDCVHLSVLPFPLPYRQTLLILLIMHWFITPMVAVQWSARPVLVFFYTFFLVFSYWSLYCISTELENPFGKDDTDLDVAELQRSLNRRLLLLLGPAAAWTPRLGASWSREAAWKVRTPLADLCGDAQDGEGEAHALLHKAGPGQSSPLGLGAMPL